MCMEKVMTPTTVAVAVVAVLRSMKKIRLKCQMKCQMKS